MQILNNFICSIIKSSYLCNVFFIVLDLRLTKGWSTAVLLFLCPYSKTDYSCSYFPQNRIYLHPVFCYCLFGSRINSEQKSIQLYYKIKIINRLWNKFN